MDKMKNRKVFGKEFLGLARDRWSYSNVRQHDATPLPVSSENDGLQNIGL